MLSNCQHVIDKIVLCLYDSLINQSINQSKHISIAPYVASESEAHNVEATVQL